MQHNIATDCKCYIASYSKILSNWLNIYIYNVMFDKCENLLTKIVWTKSLKSNASIFIYLKQNYFFPLKMLKLYISRGERKKGQSANK